MMAMDLPRDLVADCRAAVHVATPAAAQDLLWETSANCSVGSLTSAWIAVRFAYPMPEGAVLQHVPDGVRPLEQNGRLVGIRVDQVSLLDRPLRFSVRTKNVRRGAGAKITPPLLEGAMPQVVAFGNGDFSFEARDALEPQVRMTAMAITLGDLSHQAYTDALHDGKALGARWEGAALVVRPTAAIGAAQGIDGELVERADKTEGVYIGVGLATAAAAAGLVYLALRFKKRSEDERAEAVLRAEIDSL